MTQLERDKHLIRTILQQTGGTTREKIVQQGGKDLYSAMDAMLDSGEIVMNSGFVADAG